MKGLSCSAISSSSFPFSLSVPVFCSSVALLRKSPYCSYRWHTRQTTLSYKARQKKRAVPSCSPLSISASSLVSFHRVVGRGVFHFIVALIISSSHLVSSPPVSNIVGRKASRLLPLFRPCFCSPPFRMKQGGWHLVVPLRDYLVFPPRLACRLGFSCRQGVSPPSRSPVSSHQMSGK